MPDYYGNLYFDKDTLQHYGMPFRSGRYPWGSGENPYQHGSGAWYAERQKKLDSGMTDDEIRQDMGLTTTEYRRRISLGKQMIMEYNIRTAKQYAEKGMSKVAIAEKMGVNESVVRSWLKKSEDEAKSRSMAIAESLIDELREKGVLDVGKGVELGMNCSRESLDAALTLLEDEGFIIDNVYLPQITNDRQRTTIKIVATPDAYAKKADLYLDPSLIKSVETYTTDNGKNVYRLETPKSLDSKRIMVRYDEMGGTEKDGTIEIRPGVDDVSLGNAQYAQVRIAVDDSKYMKGMAFYGDPKDFPPGVDVIYNSNKSEATPDKAFKPMKTKTDANGNEVINWDNPFGALIKEGGQKHYIDENGKEQLGVVNILKEEGDWEKQSKKLPSQFLGKQSLQLAENQLNESLKSRKEQLKTIEECTNSAVKKQLLADFADGCDQAAVDLKAAALPGQHTKVLIPVTSLKDNECYAPDYPDGTRVALVRFPHGGTFEIPDLVVNNKNVEGKKYLKNAQDAIGINKNVADQLSGADFDGDTALVIPNNDRKISTKKPLAGLKGFSTDDYPRPEGAKRLEGEALQKEMGIVSNLITDMTLRKATDEELTRAVKYSMVVIDAEKHDLDYKACYNEMNIGALKNKYQKAYNPDGKGGASTLLSKAKSPVYIPEQKLDNTITAYDPKTGRGNTDPKTGEYINKATNRSYQNKKGETQYYQEKVPLMSTVKDAYELSSGLAMENLYANYANNCKAMANAARKEYLATPNTKISKTAKTTYKAEVDSLNSKLMKAKSNAPKERQAQVIATTEFNILKRDNPNMDKKEASKVRQQLLDGARSKVGAGKEKIKVTQKEWEAIQAGAVSNNVLTEILTNADMDIITKYAFPKTSVNLTSAKKARIKALNNRGYTLATIADTMGISVSTVSEIING